MYTYVLKYFFLEKKYNFKHFERHFAHFERHIAFQNAYNYIFFSEKLKNVRGLSSKFR